MSVCVSVCASIHISIHIYIHPSIFLCMHLFAHPFVHHAHLFIIYSSPNAPVRPSVRPFTHIPHSLIIQIFCLCTCLSVHSPTPHPGIHSFIFPHIHTFIKLLLSLCTCFSVRLPTHSSIHPSIYSSICPSTPPFTYQQT